MSLTITYSIKINSRLIEISKEQAENSIEYAKKLIGNSPGAIKHFKKNNNDFAFLDINANYDADEKTRLDVASYFLIAISTIVMSVVLSAYFTFEAGKEAYKTRQELLALKVDMLAHQEIYNSIESILTATYTDQCCKAVFSACFIPGCGLLTAATVLVLLGLITGSPFSLSVNSMAIAGGTFLGVGLMGHCVMRPLIRKIVSSELMTDYDDLLENVRAIEENEVHLEQEEKQTLTTDEEATNSDIDWEITDDIGDDEINTGKPIPTQTGNT